MICWKRTTTWFGGQLVNLTIGKFPIEIHYHWNDVRQQMSRAFVSVGWDRDGTHYGVLFQHYREGYEFEEHTDGPKSNKVLTFLLHHPKRGGEFFGKDVRRWLGGRVLAFDGALPHGVTRIERGSRTVLMFQRGRW
jgi:predicted 2-oxoglutarate/Fe(II)-dependent dioxygenase YbiX